MMKEKFIQMRVSDVLTTVKYFRDRADEYHLDPERILTIGFSAGGHVVSVAKQYGD